MKKNILLILLTSVFLSCNGQETKIEMKEKVELKLPPLPKKIDKDNLIGFACYDSGENSMAIKIITMLLKDKDYYAVRRKLTAKSPAEKYLATIVCNELEKNKIISLTNLELEYIKNNMNSNEKTTICSGCTNEEEIMLKEIFSSKTFLERNIKEWLKQFAQ